MGRIQRKKTSVKKKKRIAGTSGDPASADLDISNKKNASANGPAGEIAQKRQVAAQKRTVPSNRAPAAAPKAKEGVIGKSIQFLREVKAELRKVTWPSRKQTIGSTIVVIILVLIISSFLGAADIVLSYLVRLVLQ